MFEWLTVDEIVKGYNLQLVAMELLELTAFIYVASKATDTKIRWYLVGACFAAMAIICRIGFWFIAAQLAETGQTYVEWAFEYRAYLWFPVQLGVIGICFILRSGLERVFGTSWLGIPVLVSLLIWFAGAKADYWLTP